MRCPACGEDVVAEAVYCHKCGHRLDAESGPAADSPPGAEALYSPAETPAAAFAPRRDGKDQPEQELWRGGYSPKAMLGSWIMSGCISLILLLVGIFWVRHLLGWLILVLGMVLPWLYSALVLTHRRMSVHYTLSTQRFIHEHGILRRVNDRIELLDVDDITFEQTLWERLAGVGTLRIASHDRSDPELVLKGIDNIQHIASIFDNARLAERRRRGVHVEQI